MTTEEELRNAPIAVMAQKMLAVDIVGGRPASVNTLRFFLLQAVFNIVRHSSFFVMDRQLSFYFGNYFFLWTEPDYVINAGVILGQILTIGCGFPYYYFVTRNPKVLEPTLRILTTIYGLTPSSLAVRTINKLRHRLSKCGILLKFMIVSMVAFDLQLMYLGHTLVGDDDFLQTAIFWPFVQFVAGIGTCLITFGTALLFLSQNCIFTARLRRVHDQLMAINHKLQKYPTASLASRVVNMRTPRALIAVLVEYEQIRLDIAACNKFWKFAAIGLAFCSPAITLCLYYSVAKNMDVIAILITAVMIVTLAFGGSLFFLSASQVNNMVIKL